MIQHISQPDRRPSGASDPSRNAAPARDAAPAGGDPSRDDPSRDSPPAGEAADEGTPGGEGLAVRVRRLKFRSWHRGTREMDLILGRFADARLDGCTAAELDQYEALLAENDPDIYNWITGREPPPGRADTPILRALGRSIGYPGAAEGGA